MVRHVIEQHGVRDIGFIAGRKDEENSEERIAVFRKLLEEYDIPFRNDVFYYGDYWSVPALKVLLATQNPKNAKIRNNTKLA